MEGIQMYKDIVISFLGAWILRDVFGTTEVREQIAIVMGLAAMLFIFLLFCEDQAEKWKKYSQRVRDLEENLERLRGGGNGERRESTRNIADAGADTDATA